MVQLDSGVRLPMDHLAVGDRVYIGRGRFSEIFAFSHRIESGTYDFIRITTADAGALTLSAGHLVPADDRDNLVPAESLNVGDSIRRASGSWINITDIRDVKAQGLISPHTLAGEIAVDGFITSCYTMAVPSRTAHLLFLPERIAYHFGFTFVGTTMHHHSMTTLTLY